MESLEATIGYTFTQARLLTEALTHPSLSFEHKIPGQDYQRLEFLGDAVLQLILTGELFRRYPEFGEGRLTQLRSRLVSREALVGYAKEISLGEHLTLGISEEKNGGRDRPSNLADAFEAIFGAIFCDSDFPTAQSVFLTRFGSFLNGIEDDPTEYNPKGTLQEILQGLAPVSPTYDLLSQEGPDHLRSFVVAVTWQGHTLGNGEGNSKKEAEAQAASEALRLQRWKES